VTEDDREDDRESSEPGVVVGVADADRLDPDQDLVLARVVEVELLDRQPRSRLLGDGCLDLHPVPLVVGRADGGDCADCSITSDSSRRSLKFKIRHTERTLVSPLRGYPAPQGQR
jgi:hypothetical protein